MSFSQFMLFGVGKTGSQKWNGPSIPYYIKMNSKEMSYGTENPKLQSS